MFPEPSHLPCAHCGQPVDALRAPSVRMTETGALYYCSTEHARAHRLAALERAAKDALGGAGARSVAAGSPEPGAVALVSTTGSSPRSAASLDSLKYGAPPYGVLTYGGARYGAPTNGSATYGALTRAAPPQVLPLDTSLSPAGAPTQSSGSFDEDSTPLPSFADEPSTSASLLPELDDLLATGEPPSTMDVAVSLLPLFGATTPPVAPGLPPLAAQPERRSGFEASLRGRATSERRPPAPEDGQQRTWPAYLLPVLLVLGLASAVWLLRPAEKTGPLMLLLTVSLWALVSSELARRLSCTSLSRRDALFALLHGSARRISENGETFVVPAELRAGEELRLSAGEILLADAVVVSGAATVRFLPQGHQLLEASEGQRLPAGAQVERGELRVVCAQTGPDATFFRLASGRQEGESFLVQSAQRAARKVAPIALGVTFGLSLWWTSSLVEAASVALANFAALSTPLPALLLKQIHRKWLLALASRGVHLSPGAVDAAAQVTQCVFCTRGTVLSGEPEVAEIHALRGSTEEEVLALAAGAESVVEHPAASSILRAAHARGVGPDRSRGHDVVPGMGVLCFSSHGDPLVVGSRDLLLRERVSIAVAEELLRKLENRGRMGILVAKSGRLVGVLALHDAVRVGAKAAIQLLIDGHIEPVLLSGDTRSTSEALGRALSVDHIRPEVPARERGAIVKELTLGGAAVAVVGHSPLDDSALSGANTSIVLDAAALPQQQGSIAVLSSDVQLAAEALLSTQRLRREATIAWALAALPTVLGVLSATSLLFPPVVAPILAALGGIFASAWVFNRRQDCSPSPRYGTPQG